MKKTIFATLSVALLMASCGPKYDAPKAKLNRADFQTTIDGKQNDLYILTNKNGMEVTLTNYGARIVSICVPDRDGNFADVVLGFDNIQDYLDNKTDFGAFIGRYGNRINEGRFTLDGVEYQLSCNNDCNGVMHHLHGGEKGFQYQMFDVEQTCPCCLTVTYVSADGEMGFPGQLTVKGYYTLTDKNALVIRYEAVTDKPTIVNLTNHSYFNLSGRADCVLNHRMKMNADAYTPIDDHFMTTGEIASVANTPMEFRCPSLVGDRIDNYDFEQLKKADGYDHNYVLNTRCPGERALRIADPSTGRAMDVFTSEPGIQVYTGNFLDGSLTGKHGVVYNRRAAICLETQHFPDSPNKPEWPSVVLRPGETYQSFCVYAFNLMPAVCHEDCADCQQNCYYREDKRSTCAIWRDGKDTCVIEDGDIKKACTEWLAYQHKCDRCEKACQHECADCQKACQKACADCKDNKHECADCKGSKKDCQHECADCKDNKHECADCKGSKKDCQHECADCQKACQKACADCKDNKHECADCKGSKKDCQHDCGDCQKACQKACVDSKDCKSDCEKACQHECDKCTK